MGAGRYKSRSYASTYAQALIPHTRANPSLTVGAQIGALSGLIFLDELTNTV
jgi:hypothetical protein